MAIFFRIPEVCQKSKFSASFFVPLKLFTGCPPSSLTGGLIPLFRLILSNSVLYWKRKQTDVCAPMRNPRTKSLEEMSMKYGRTYNFSAGPAMMPEEVLEEIAAEMMNYRDRKSVV